MHDPRNVADASERRRAAAVAGHAGDAGVARASLDDPAPSVRATALGALARMGALGDADVRAAMADADAVVRRRACEVAAASGVGAHGLAALLRDPDAAVVEVAAWALGEVADRTAVPALAEVATSHRDALAREAAVAALGAIGDPRGLEAILAGTRDKPAVRRRAVLALAPFSGPEVDEAIARAADDRDWQVRDAARLLSE